MISKYKERDLAKTYLLFILGLFLLSACKFQTSQIQTIESLGSSWQALGGALDEVLANNARNPSIAIRTDNLPVQARTENAFTGNYTTYVKQWNGTSWVPLGPAITTPDSAYPSLALDTNNVPHLAWIEYTYNNGNEYRVKFAKLVGNTWKGINGTSSPNTLNGDISHALSPSLALDSSGNPSVAWTNAARVYVRSWAGSVWINRNFPVPSVSEVSLALNNSTSSPVVAYTALVGSDYSVYVRRWNPTSSTWSTYGNTVDAVATHGFYPKLKLASNNIPYVVYEERLGSDRSVFVKKWAAGSWQMVAGNVDYNLNTTTADTYPALILKSNNAPIVSWSEFAGSSNGYGNLYVKQY